MVLGQLHLTFKVQEPADVFFGRLWVVGDGVALEPGVKCCCEGVASPVPVSIQGDISACTI